MRAHDDLRRSYIPSPVLGMMLINLAIALLIKLDLITWTLAVFALQMLIAVTGVYWNERRYHAFRQRRRTAWERHKQQVADLIAAARRRES